MRRRVPELEVDGRVHTRLLEVLFGRIDVWSRPVLVLERLRGVLESLRDHRVERLHRAVVDVLGDSVAIDRLRDRPAYRQLLRIARARLEALVEDEVADLLAVPADDVDAVGVGQVLEVRWAEASISDVDVAVLHGELERRRLVEVLDNGRVVLGRIVARVLVVALEDR